MSINWSQRPGRVLTCNSNDADLKSRGEDEREADGGQRGEKRGKNILSWKGRRKGRRWKRKKMEWRERRIESAGDDAEREREREMTECWHQRASSPCTSLSLHGKSILRGMDDGVNSGQDQQLYSLASTININRQSGNSTLQVLLQFLWSSDGVLGRAPEKDAQY